MDEEKTTKQEPISHICKRCGFDQTQEFTPVSETDLQDYFKAALGQIAYSKTYDLFGGRLRCTFEEATGKLLRLQEMLLMDRAKENGGSMSDVADFSLLSSLAQVIQVTDTGIPRVLYGADAAQREKILSEGVIPEEIANMGIITLQSLRTAYMQFSKLCLQLTQAAEDENFWKGIGRS